MEEGSNGEAVFESLNLSPQLFLNEVRNLVDDRINEACDYFLEEASSRLKTDGTDRSAELRQGVSYIRDLILLTMDQRMDKWVDYCLRFCFSVPEGFRLPKANDELHGDESVDLDALGLIDRKLDEQLYSLRDRLSLVEKENVVLLRELQTLEGQSLSSKKSAGSIDEAVQLYNDHGATTIFQEMIAMSSDLRAKLGNLKRKRVEETQRDRADRLNATDDGVLGRMPHGNGIFGAKLEQLQEFLDEITM